jgi:hypothetical protein
VSVPAGELHPIELMGWRAGRGTVNLHKTSVKVVSFPLYVLERVMTTISAWKFNAVRGAGEVLPKLAKLNRDFLVSLLGEVVVCWEAGRNKPKAVILSIWRLCEGGCEHVPCP